MLRTSATELALRMHARDLSPVEVVRAHIERIEAVNPQINALVERRYDAALHDAERAERRIAGHRAGRDEPLPPLLGVPCTIKSAFAVEGMPWNAGLAARRRIVAREDGLTVARLRSAGAIPMGLTNVPEGLMWFETYNALYGRTGNPYDPGRTAGGSSGGEGAVVGSGGSPFGLGSDVAGSIRLPAFFCGVFGHKPSGGRVPCDGQFPPTWGPRARVLSTGPLTRRAEDLLPLTRILADPDWRDGRGRSHGWDVGDALAAGDARDLRVLVVEDNGRIPVRPEMRAAVRRAGRALADRGARVEPWSHPSLRRSLELWLGLMDEAQGWTFAEILGDGAAIPLGRSMLRAALGRGQHILPSLMLCAFERTAPTFSGDWLTRFADEGRALAAELEDRLGDDGVLLHPPFPRTAMRHRVALLRPYEFAYCALFNVLRLPSTQVPLGLGATGMPLGTQVVGAEGRDALTIATARVLEAELGGWTPPADLPTAGPAMGKEG